MPAETFLGPVEFLASPQALGRTWTLDAAQAYTRWLATHHYENFHVVSFLLPRRLHQDFYNVYAFCRWADDLGDETGDRAESLRLLAWWQDELDGMYAGQASHPVFVALQNTARRHDIPRQPFAGLIRAFVQDQSVNRYRDWDSLLEYCRYSANPVGRLVLYLCGYSDPERQKLSDATCTALQLANFWQDVAVDLTKDRVYIPLDLLERHGCPLEDVLARRFTPAFREAMREAVNRARALFEEGLPLTGMVSRRLGVDLDLFSRGGLRILDKIEAQDYDVLSARPAISKSERAGLLVAAMWRTLQRPQAEPGHNGSSGASSRAQVERSNEYCSNVARARARNFYYAFRLLPRERRNAMCALYAFMRYCDDLSDEPGANRAAIDRWRGDLDNALEGRFSGHPAWPAFHDAVQRFGIPAKYFHEMIDGVASDLEPRRFDTFGQLYGYCYQVASVAGLTSLYIFGFESPAALEAGEKCGIAFQLTNILRDLREDVENGRVYLPLEDLRRFGVTEDDIRAGRLGPAFRDLMRFEVERARAYYRESRDLPAMVKPSSRPSLRALIAIYSQLLERIESKGYDVFTERVRLSGLEKSWIAARALATPLNR